MEYGYCKICKRQVALTKKGNCYRHNFKRSRGMNRSWLGFELGISQEDGIACRGTGKKGLTSQEFSNYLDEILKYQEKRKNEHP